MCYIKKESEEKEIQLPSKSNQVSPTKQPKSNTKKVSSLAPSRMSSRSAKNITSIPDDTSIWGRKLLENHIKQLEKVINRKNAWFFLHINILREIVDTLTDTLMENGDV